MSRLQIVVLAIGIVLIARWTPATKASGPLRVQPTNPRYFTDDLDNVLYEISNESEYGADWHNHLARVIQDYEATKPKRHPVGITGGGPTNDELFSGPADWISPTGWTDPPAGDGRKVVIIDTDHIGHVSRTWVWRSFLRGHNPILMDWMDKPSPWYRPADQEALRRAMGHTRRFAERMDLAAMTPHSDLASTGYCLANPGREYLAYRPASEASLAVSLPAGTYDYEWFDPGTGATGASGSLTVTGGERSFSAPFTGEAVLYLKRREVPTWFPKAPVLPPPQGEVLHAATADELLAAVDRVGPGGTILLADGHYRLPRVAVLREKKNIAIRSAAGDPAKVVLSGKGWDSENRGDDILHVGRCDGVTIADLTFADCRSYGIKVEAEPDAQRRSAPGPKDVHIYNCRFRDIGVRAIKGSAGQDPNVRAVKGSVRYCRFENTKVPPAEWLFGGDYIAAIDMMALEDWTFSDNVFRNIKGRNGGARAAIFIWVRSRRVTVERNLIIDCDRGVAFGNPGQSTANLAGERLVYVSDGVIRNNFIAGGPDCGIELWYADRIKVHNNSIWRPERNWARGIRIGTGTAHTEIVNNLVHGEIRFEGGQAELRSNLAGRLDGYFVDPASGDLTLTSAAVGAIDQGVRLPDVPDDIRGRPRTGPIDLGAWELDQERKMNE